MTDSTQHAISASKSIRCAHCGLESRGQFPETCTLQNPASNAESEDTPKFFCCRGCMGAYSLIHELGLENFYSLRSLSDHEAEPRLRSRASEVLKDLSESGVSVENLTDGSCQVRLGVEGLH
ncbi:MAG: heavy metal translocating P-type ATPase metal-binding domain-containing protein, partial [Pirellula sp.]